MDVEHFLATGRGANIIQVSISLADETVEGCCTEIVPGFYCRIIGWWESLILRIRSDSGRLFVLTFSCVTRKLSNFIVTVKLP